MNIERLEYIALWLEGGAMHEKITFDMRQGVRFKELIPMDLNATMACGAACCIAGAATWFFNDVPKMLREDVREMERAGRHFLHWGRTQAEARQLLELSEDATDALFQPSYGDLDQFNDPAWAARVIRNLIATGKVDWKGCK
jgi:hypothetical protein